MEDLAEGLPAAKWMHAYCFNLLASHSHSSNVRMSLLQTGPFVFAHGGGLLSSKNLTCTNVPHPSAGYTCLLAIPQMTWNCQT